MAKARKDFRVKLAEPHGANYREVRWRVKWAAMAEEWGEVDHDFRIVRLDPSLEDEEALGVAWHEAIHVAQPHLNEAAVLILEYNLRAMDAAIRRNLGYEVC